MGPGRLIASPTSYFRVKEPADNEGRHYTTPADSFPAKDSNFARDVPRYSFDTSRPTGYTVDGFIAILRDYTAMVNYTAKYTKIDSGYMGQLVEWPEVVTEGKDLEECRALLRDALQEMVLAYRQLGKEIPAGNALLEQLPVEVERVRQAT